MVKYSVKSHKENVNFWYLNAESIAGDVGGKELHRFVSWYLHMSLVLALRGGDLKPPFDGHKIVIDGVTYKLQKEYENE